MSYENLAIVEALAQISQAVTEGGVMSILDEGLLFVSPSGDINRRMRLDVRDAITWHNNVPRVSLFAVDDTENPMLALILAMADAGSEMGGFEFPVMVIQEPGDEGYAYFISLTGSVNIEGELTVNGEPIGGGDADTVDGLHAEEISREHHGSLGGYLYWEGEIDTAELIEILADGTISTGVSIEYKVLNSVDDGEEARLSSTISYIVDNSEVAVNMWPDEPSPGSLTTFNGAGPFVQLTDGGKLSLRTGPSSVSPPFTVSMFIHYS